MDEKGDVKIGDLGTSKQLSRTSRAASTRIYTPIYAAPELLTKESYGIEVDAWDLGCIGYELCRLAHVFNSEREILRFVLNIYTPDPIPRASPGKTGGYSKLLCETIYSLLNGDPRERLSIKNMLDNPEIKSIRERLKIGIEAPIPTRTSTIRYRSNYYSERKDRASEDVIECDKCHLNICFQDYIKHYQTHVPQYHKLFVKK